MSKKLVFVIAAVAAIGVLIFAWYSQQGEVAVTISAQSQVKNGIEFTLSVDKYRHPYSAPTKITLRPGKYTIYAYGGNSDVFRQDFTVSSGKTIAVAITLGPNPNQLNSSTLGEDGSTSPYLGLFPHYDEEFEARATFSSKDGKISLASVTVVPYLPIPAGKPFDAKEVASAKKSAVAAAKSWLKQQSVPSSVPVLVDSAF